MRWKQKPRTTRYSVRTARKFLFLPKCINGECRWLEVAMIQQRYEWPDWKDYAWTPEIITRQEQATKMTAAPKDELLPCPFCGGKPIRHRHAVPEPAASVELVARLICMTGTTEWVDWAQDAIEALRASEARVAEQVACNVEQMEVGVQMQRELKHEVNRGVAAMCEIEELRDRLTARNQTIARIRKALEQTVQVIRQVHDGATAMGADLPDIRDWLKEVAALTDTTPTDDEDTA